MSEHRPIAAREAPNLDWPEEGHPAFRLAQGVHQPMARDGQPVANGIANADSEQPRPETDGGSHDERVRCAAVRPTLVAGRHPEGAKGQVGIGDGCHAGGRSDAAQPPIARVRVGGAPACDERSNREMTEGGHGVRCIQATG